MPVVLAARSCYAARFVLSEIYASLAFPAASATRPYTFINMVATIDGKTVSGDRSEDVLDLGSKFDHTLMRRIEDRADAVIVGGTTLRAASRTWDPRTRFRIVVSRTGDFDYERPFFRGGGTGIVACPASARFETPPGIERLEAGEAELDFALLSQRLRNLGSERLLCFGGSELNAQFLRNDLVDELFLTIAPKVKLGRALPTYAGGDPLSREQMLAFALVEHHVEGDEVFLRYRRRRSE